MTKRNDLLCWTMLGAALLLATGASCADPHGANGQSDEAVVLRTYLLPEKESPERVRAMLQRLLDRGENEAQWSVQMTQRGILSVVAPERIQKGIPELLEQIAKKESHPPRTIEMTYWIVVEEPGEGSSFDESLSEIAEPLRQIGAGEGEVHLRLLERLRLRSLSDGRARIAGSHAMVSQTVSVGPNSLLADVGLSLSSPVGRTSLDTRLHLDEGKHLILGESALSLRQDGEDAPGRLFYVVRGQVKN